MTNPTPHGQVPEALIDLIDAYAETRHRCGGIYNAKTEAARKAVIEALSGVQALSAAPAVLSDEAILNRTGCIDYSPGTAEYDLELIRWYRTQIASPAPQQSRPLSHPNREIPGLAQGAAITSESPTPPAEQQATKETSGGIHVWRDIYTAPKDGSRFVATGHNYGLYSEVRHTCVAQWFQGCWMEASDWNETSELKYLTHWMPLPSPPDDVAAPAEQQAQPGAVGRTGCTAGTDEECTRRGCATSCPAQQAAPKAAPVEPSAFPMTGDEEESDLGQWQPGTAKPNMDGTYLREFDEGEATSEFHQGVWLRDGFFPSDLQDVRWRGRTAPQPAPDCHHRPPCDECAAIAAQGGKA